MNKKCYFCNLLLDSDLLELWEFRWRASCDWVEREFAREDSSKFEKPRTTPTINLIEEANRRVPQPIIIKLN